MPHGSTRIAVLLLLVGLIAGPRPAPAEPVVELTDEGRTLIYTARPGDTPAAVAAAFGIAPDQLGAFLVANGIRDDKAVPRGFRYRIANPVAAEAAALAARQGELEAATEAARARAAELERSLHALREHADFAAAQRRRLETLELRWSIALWVVALLIVGVVVALAFAVAAVRKEQQAERWARSLAHEAEEKRRTGLVERQQAAKRVVELEARVRELEQATSRVRAIGR